MRIDTRGAENRTELSGRMQKVFQEICTVKVDKIEFLEPGSLKDDIKPVVDERAWK
jgi:hypothetical protein